jgi:hypothetical protein
MNSADTPMFVPKKPETVTEKVLALRAARDAALEALRSEAYMATSGGYKDSGPVYQNSNRAFETYQLLRDLDHIRTPWREVLVFVAPRIRSIAREVTGYAVSNRLVLTSLTDEEKAKNDRVYVLLDETAKKLEASVEVFDSLVNHVLAERVDG